MSESASVSARASVFAIGLASFALAGCPSSAPSLPPPPTSTQTAKPAVTSEPAPEASAAASTEAAPCEPSLPDPPPIATSAAGAAYVLVSHVGVLRFDSETGDVTTVIPIPPDRSTWRTGLVIGPAGELWMSDWQGVRVLDPGSNTPRDIRVVKDGPLYEHLIPRQRTDVWAVDTDIEWSILHYEGKAWKPVRKRGQFQGKYDDNKFSSLAVTSEGVWVSSWNGLWLGAGNDWKKITIPGGREGDSELVVYRDHLIAGGFDGYFIREGDAFRRLGWPAKAGRVLAINEAGLAVGGGLNGQTVMIGSIEGGACVAVGSALKGGNLSDVAVDQGGRVWVATDYALSVLDRAGRVLAQWTPGTLPGFGGKAEAIAVVASGPKRLPAAQAGRSIDLVGRMKLYKSSAPLAGASIEICPQASARGGCAGAPFVRTAVTSADGSFRFPDVFEGELSIHVSPPPGEQSCETPFTVTGDTVVIPKDCKELKGASGASGVTGAAIPPGEKATCNLGEITQCLPFEMPPPPPHR